MDKKTLTNLFSDVLFKIPDYQRGYAWEKDQWSDFVQDIDALIGDDVTSHYTGTVVVYEPRNSELKPYGSTRRFKQVDVVDGQQRLTTCCLYLSTIISALRDLGEQDFESEIPNYLYAGSTSKLSLSNDSQGVFLDVLRSGHANVPPQAIHGQRLIAAHEFFRKHLNEQLNAHGERGVEYLRSLFTAITQKLAFTHYTIEEENEIGMTFELMNSRGKDLTILEKLKNYFMYWVNRNVADRDERTDLTNQINKNWKDVYANLGMCYGNEDQCLRVAWTLYCNHVPGNWNGYAGFKQDDYFPLRRFSEARTKQKIKELIIRFAEGLAETSGYYASIMNPQDGLALSSGEKDWLTKIHHTDNVANFLPMMIAAHKRFRNGRISESDYIELLKALECYAYRVFLFGGRRGNAGQSSLFRWGFEIFEQRGEISDVTAGIYELARFYEPEESFISWSANPDNWYAERRLLKYTLFEYELHLLKEEGKHKEPRLAWEQLGDSTIEHILPQNPEDGSHWKEVWSEEEFKSCLHDIGNLVLTRDNSSYNRFEFIRKRGSPGIGPSYSNSDIRQERKISKFSDWTPAEFNERRAELVSWVHGRWKTERKPSAMGALDLVNDSDEA